MKHFHRTHLPPDAALAEADAYFPTLGLAVTATDKRTRTFTGALGTLMLSVTMEGGHYTMLEVHTNQMGESRLDRNVKRYFVRVHRASDPTHRIEAAY